MGDFWHKDREGWEDLSLFKRFLLVKFLRSFHWRSWEVHIGSCSVLDRERGKSSASDPVLAGEDDPVLAGGTWALLAGGGEPVLTGVEDPLLA